MIKKSTYSKIRNSLNSSVRKYVPTLKELDESEIESVYNAIKEYKKVAGKNEGLLTHGIKRRLNYYGRSVAGAKALLKAYKISAEGQAEITRSTELFGDFFYPDEEVARALKYAESDEESEEIASDYQNRNKKLMSYLEKQTELQKGYEEKIKKRKRK